MIEGLLKTEENMLARLCDTQIICGAALYDFDAVLEGCAEPRPGRPRTWINACPAAWPRVGLSRSTRCSCMVASVWAKPT